ncbi:hypothetical protein [Deinococcus sp.]|uniref:hypothetical protein n=1 Tax=Deinococcus sp. TaxID=47478 RepID=UPI003B5CC6CA
MSSPETRDEYRHQLLFGLYQLVQAIETDDDTASPVSLAQRLHHDARQYVDRERWRPTPVYDGVTAHCRQGRG